MSQNQKPEVVVQIGHTNWVRSIAVSPDGKYILSASQDNTLKLWDINTAKEIKNFSGYTNWIYSVTFSHDGKYALSGGSDKTLKLWDINSGTEIKTFSGHKDVVHSVAFSPDDKYALSGSWDNSIKLWDVSSGKVVRTYSKNTTCVNSVAFSPDGKYALSGNLDGSVKLWEVTTGKEVRSFVGHSKEIFSVAFSPDGKYAVSGGEDEYLILWDIKSGKIIKNFPGHSDVINSVAFSQDGRYVLSGSDDKTIRLWNIESGKVVKIFTGHAGSIESVAFTPDDKYVLSGSDDCTINLWDIKSGQKVKTFSGLSNIFYSSSFSTDNENIYTVCGDSTLKCWDIGSLKILKTIPQISISNQSVAYTSDSNLALSGLQDSILRLFDLKTGKEIKSFSGHTNWITSVVFSSDCNYALSGSFDNTLKLWDVNSGNEIKTFSGHKNWVYSVALSHDDMYALSGSQDKTIKLWDINSGKEVKTFSGHTYGVNSVGFSSDDRFLISSGWDNKVKLWDVNSGSEILSLISFGENDYVAITPDNYYLCSKNGLKSIVFVTGNHVYPPEQFDLQYNRPDIVLERMGLASQELIDAYRKAYEKRLKKMKFNEEMFNNDFHMPEILLLKENIPLTTTNKNFTFKIKAEDTKYLLDRINLYVNDVALYGNDGIDLRDKQSNKYESNINLELSEGKNKIQVSALNEKGVESLKETIEITYESPKKKHDLYLITIGASDYDDSRYKLRYAAKDANDIADLLMMQKDKYNNIKVTRLLNKEVTKENIQNIRGLLMQSSVDDEVIIFIAGHGLLTKDFNYYFATADIDFNKPEQRGVTFEEIENLLNGIPARKKILLMDTCHSGELDKEDLQLISANEKTQERGEPIFTRESNEIKVTRKNESEGFGLKNISELMQEMFVDLRRGSGAAVISSSGGLEVSYEGGEYKNGFFTYAILDGIKTMNADRNKDGFITVSELLDYVSDKVEKLTKGVQKPTARKENPENDFIVW